MKIEVHRTQRGFVRADFVDANGCKASIQESSSASEPKLWLGLNEGTHHMGECLGRMHLTMEHTRALLPLLAWFAETGDLPNPVEVSAWTPDMRYDPLPIGWIHSGATHCTHIDTRAAVWFSAGQWHFQRFQPEGQPILIDGSATTRDESMRLALEPPP